MGLGICLTHYWNKKITAKEIFTMKEIILGNHIRKVPSIAVGCMRLSEKSKDEMNRFIHAALEQPDRSEKRQAAERGGRQPCGHDRLADPARALVRR